MSQAYIDAMQDIEKIDSPISNFDANAARAAGMTEKELDKVYEAIAKHNAKYNQKCLSVPRKRHERNAGNDV